jgi:hypothetical protein
MNVQIAQEIVSRIFHRSTITPKEEGDASRPPSLIA